MYPHFDCARTRSDGAGIGATATDLRLARRRSPTAHLLASIPRGTTAHVAANSPIRWCSSATNPNMAQRCELGAGCSRNGLKPRTSASRLRGDAGCSGRARGRLSCDDARTSDCGLREAAATTRCGWLTAGSVPQLDLDTCAVDNEDSAPWRRRHAALRDRWRAGRFRRQPCAEAEAKSGPSGRPLPYCRQVSPAEDAARELFAFHDCVWMSPETFADALGIGCSTVLRAIRNGELGAIACGGGDASRASKPYRIFRSHAAAFFSQRNTMAAARPASAKVSSPAAAPARATPTETAPQTTSPQRTTRPQQRPAAVALVTRRER